MNAANLTLLWQLLRRDLHERYAGTALGVLWLLVQPLFMLLVYALVFGEILHLRFGGQGGYEQFAAYLFAGLTAFNTTAEVLVKAPALLTGQRDLLLNSPLPPALLPLLPVVSSLVLELLSIALLCVWLCVQGNCPAPGIVFYLPFLFARLLLSTGLAYFLAVLGVFLRDLRQLVPTLLGVLLLVSAVVYPPEMVPEGFRFWLHINPLAQLAEAYRSALVDGVFHWQDCLMLLLQGGVLLGLAWLVFQRLMPRARYVL